MDNTFVVITGKKHFLAVVQAYENEGIVNTEPRVTYDMTSSRYSNRTIGTTDGKELVFNCVC